jgi:plastocyanin
MKKTFIALFISIFLFQVTGFAYDATFSDVSSSNTNFVAIEYLVSNGTLAGYSDGTFKPSQTINRAELMKILVAGQGVDPDANAFKNCFSDVTTDWYAKYVCYADAQGWVDGYSDGSFKPEQTVNRAEAAKMVVNAYGFALSQTSSAFGDVSGNDWFYGYVMALVDLGVVELDASYNPANGMNRGGTAEYIFRAQVLKDSGESIYSQTVRDDYLMSVGKGDLVGGTASGDQTVEMEIGNYFFTPSTITATAGTSVTIHFSDVTGNHVFDIDELNVHQSISAGGSVTFMAPSTPGSYIYYCSVGSHRSMGMEGTLTVE